jgi:hypothetical protein
VLRPDGSNFLLRREFATRFLGQRSIELGFVFGGEFERGLDPSELQQEKGRFVLLIVWQGRNGGNGLFEKFGHREMIPRASKIPKRSRGRVGTLPAC